MLGKLTDEEIENVLKTEVLGRIGTIMAGKPYITPVTYVYDVELGEVYFHTGEGSKLQAMRDNPNVCFEVEQVRSMANWSTVMAQARFEELWHDREGRALELLASRFADVPISETAKSLREEDVHRRHGASRTLLCRLRLLEKTGRYEQT
jgi:nitroimidazol reductase NimA-like FMN-containing flavoprotein (pyridoxamine 5'-phosphate oxidase superfamily)